jgi:hypothetical protein
MSEVMLTVLLSFRIGNLKYLLINNYSFENLTQIKFNSSRSWGTLILQTTNGITILFIIIAPVHIVVTEAQIPVP